jgi:carbon-monoxide dehydrogenase iron sulfur subunit
MGRTLTINAKNCTGCRMCELACSSSKEGEFIPERSRIRVVNNPLEGWSRPAVCLQCEDPMCLAVCPSRAITKTRTPAGDPLVAVDKELCVGCHRCLMACPVGAIDFFPKMKAVKCDLCGGSPRCAQFCFYDCLRFTDLAEEEREARDKRIKILFNRAAVDITRRELWERRKRFSLEASRAGRPIRPPEEDKKI